MPAGGYWLRKRLLVSLWLNPNVMNGQLKWFFAALKPDANNWLIWTESLILLAGLFYGNWNPLVVVFAYFLETIIIGLIHMAKMWATLRLGRAQQHAVFSAANTMFAGTFAIVFFLVHYFFFVFGQSIFVFSFFGRQEFGFESAFHVFNNYYILLQRPDMQLVLGIVIATQLGNAIMYFFVPGKYNLYTLEQLFLQPYLRIVVQQMATILTGFFMLLLGGPHAAALLLIVVRLVIDCTLVGAKHNPTLRLALQNALLKKETPEEKAEAQKLLEVWLDQ